MTAKTVMVQGAMSSVGKSLLVTGLCHLFSRRGIKVAPFKAQNMSNNAAVCRDGSEIGRAQFTQALACNIEPTAEMNPVLLKPESAQRSQVVVMGRRRYTLPAGAFYQHKTELWQAVTNALDNLRKRFDLVIIEGAGSPAEINLRRGDIVNMAVACYAQSPVLLAGDIERGGVFAQLLGTLFLLEPEERRLVKGLIINKFRGDLALFYDGVHILEERGKVPVVGVVPYLHGLVLPEEDAVALEAGNPQGEPESTERRDRAVDIAVIHLPRIANFDDFDPLAGERGVRLRYVSSVQELGEPAAVILPGTKSTIDDLLWLKEQGLAEAVRALGQQGSAVVGICGGYQMLGVSVHDPEQIESRLSKVTGLGLLPLETIFSRKKISNQAQAEISGGVGWMAGLMGQRIQGYEIHMGRGRSKQNWLTIRERSGSEVQVADGAFNFDGRVWGCYLHGLFANKNLRRHWLRSLGWQPSRNAGDADQFHASLTHLADALEASLDMALLEKIISEI